MNRYRNFNCPYCYHKYIDELEVLDDDVLHAFRCESCHTPFVMLANECSACTFDTVVVWREAPPVEVTSSLRCGKCDRPLYPVDNHEQVE